MSERIERFDVEGRPHISVRALTGDIRTVDGAAGSVVVRLRGHDRDLERYLVEEQGGTVTVEPDRTQRGRTGTVSVLVEIGEPAFLHIRTASGNLTVEAPLAELTVDTAAGDMRIGEVSEGVRVKSASGDLRLGTVGRRLTVATAAGDVSAEAVGGDLELKSASGDVRVRRVGGNVSAQSAAGDIRIDAFEGGELNIKTLSGDVAVGVAAGRRYRVSFSSLSGDIHTDFPVSEEGSGGAPARLRIRSMSGDIRIEPARS